MLQKSEGIIISDVKCSWHMNKLSKRICETDFCYYGSLIRSRRYTLSKRFSLPMTLSDLSRSFQQIWGIYGALPAALSNRLSLVLFMLNNVNKLRTTMITNKLCGRPPQYAPAPCKLTFDLLTLKVVSESRVTWATSVPILVFLGLSLLD